VQTQFARLAVLRVGVVGNIQVHIIAQPDNLTLDGNLIIVNETQVNIGRVAQQRLFT